MCGIFGLILSGKSKVDKKKLKPALDYLFKLSESRGKEASGIALLLNDSIDVYKSSKPASVLIKTDDYKNLFEKIKNGSIISRLAVIGHARLVTNGNMSFNQNNQPVVKDNSIVVHNGIITNDKELWEKYSLERKYDVDTEIILSLINYFHSKNIDLSNAVSNTYKNIEGSASIGALFKNSENLVLATNTGSLYFCQSKKYQISIFASEFSIIKKAIRKTLSPYLEEKEIRQIKAGSGFIVNLKNNSVTNFYFKDRLKNYQNKKMILKSSKIINRPSTQNKIPFNHNHRKPEIYKSVMNEYLQNKKAIEKIKRCSKCILPETMPFIEFNKDGVCNYCRNYQKMDVFGPKELEKKIKTFRRKDGKPDCIVAFSGGRDSSFGLHYVKNVLKMNPVAFSYDWGMLTDLGRRNQARMCGKLGVEHVLISANISRKREFIKNNVLAWLKKPDLGTIPLFMAGDKQYFYYLNKLKKQMGIDLVIYAENPLEKTNFKFGFCGVQPEFKNRHLYSIGINKKIKMAGYYLKKYLANPDFINNSLLDTLGAYFSSYLFPHEYLYLYQYIPWKEKLISSTLLNKYHWETAIDTKSTWRIGDGTASFYNYIYYTVAGFTENDTFRSNQIREGEITREEAISLSIEDNRPRLESLKWYCQTIDIDINKAIEKINSIHKHY